MKTDETKGCSLLVLAPRIYWVWSRGVLLLPRIRIRLFHLLPTHLLPGPCFMAFCWKEVGGRERFRIGIIRGVLRDNSFVARSPKRMAIIMIVMGGGKMVVSLPLSLDLGTCASIL